jgi:hypothetical protein
VVQGVLRQTRAENRDAVPFGLGSPFVFAVFPGALRGYGKHGELRAVAFRLPLFRIAAEESNECYRHDYVE